MLHVFYGNDTVGVRHAAFAYMAPFEEQGVTLESIDGDSFSPRVLEDVVGSVSLFGGETMYLLDTPSSSKEFNEATKDALSALAESTKQFVVIEGALLAADKKRWQQHAAEMTECKAGAAERFNTFALADALAQKDKKSLWLLLQDAKAAGQSAEEIIGVLWWQLKAVRLAEKTNNAKEAGIKDFPYNKAKRAFGKFQAGELERVSLSLLTVYHDGHGGIVDIDEGLERWVLTL